MPFFLYFFLLPGKYVLNNLWNHFRNSLQIALYCVSHLCPNNKTVQELKWNLQLTIKLLGKKKTIKEYIYFFDLLYSIGTIVIFVEKLSLVFILQLLTKYSAFIFYNVELVSVYCLEMHPRIVPNGELSNSYWILNLLLSNCYLISFLQEEYWKFHLFKRT